MIVLGISLWFVSGLVVYVLGLRSSGRQKSIVTVGVVIEFLFALLCGPCLLVTLGFSMVLEFLEYKFEKALGKKIIDFSMLRGKK